jgi:hypothetical protein
MSRASTLRRDQQRCCRNGTATATAVQDPRAVSHVVHTSRATHVPYRTVYHGPERTTTVTGAPPMG